MRKTEQKTGGNGRKKPGIDPVVFSLIPNPIQALSNVVETFIANSKN